MSSSEVPELKLLVERVSQLEKQNRRFKRLGTLLLVLLGGLTLVAAQERGKGQTIEADRFLLKDANGRIRADLGLDKNGGVRLLLNDENEKQRLNAAAFSEGPGLALFDENGAVRFSVSQSSRGPSLVFNDENQKPRSVMRLFKEGPGLAFLDEKENDRMVLSLTKTNGVSMDMLEAGKQLLVALRARNGMNGLVMFDDTGRPRAAIVDSAKNGPRIELLDENEQPVFRKP
jgi:hypothetical protein